MNGATLFSCSRRSARGGCSVLFKSDMRSLTYKLNVTTGGQFYFNHADRCPLLLAAIYFPSFPPPPPPAAIVTASHSVRSIKRPRNSCRVRLVATHSRRCFLAPRICRYDRRAMGNGREKRSYRCPRFIDKPAIPFFPSLLRYILPRRDAKGYRSMFMLRGESKSTSRILDRLLC